MLREEVIPTWEATVTTEATRAEVVRTVAAYAQEVVAAREKVEVSIKEAEAWATLIMKEAQEKMLKTEQESATLLVYVRGEVNELGQKVSFLKGVVEDACQARDMVEANFQDLSDEVACLNQRWDDAEK
jgi:hypothetical protein